MTARRDASPSVEQQGRRGAVPVAVALLAVLFVLSVSARFKVTGEEPVRPFHFEALLTFAIVALATAAAKLPVRLVLDRYVLLFGALVAWILGHGLLGDYRATADAVYIVTNSVSLVLLSVVILIGAEERMILRGLTVFVVATTYIVVIQGLLSWLFLMEGQSAHAAIEETGFEFLLPLLQSPAWIGRMHGLLGDPTVFGVFCAFMVAAAGGLAAYWRGVSKIAYRLTMGGGFLGGFGLTGSGSRMGILALVAMLGVLALRRTGNMVRVVIIVAVASSTFMVVDNLRYSTSEPLQQWLAENMDRADDSDRAGISVVGRLLRRSIRVAEHYLQETLRVTDWSYVFERRLFLTNGVNRFVEAPMAEKLFGCGVDCVKRDRTRSLNGIVDLLNNYGLVFMAVLAFLWGAIVVRLWRKAGDWLASLALAFLFGGVVVMPFGYWVFHPFFSVIQMAMVFSLALFLAERPSAGAPVDSAPGPANRTLLDYLRARLQ